MKPLSLTTFFLACLCHTAVAQVLDRVESRINDVTRELERVSGDVQEAIRKTAEDELSAQRLLDNPLNTPLTDAVTQTADGLAARGLANVLPILNQRGETVFVEVRVEDSWRAVEREWLMMLDQAGLEALVVLDVEIIEQTEFAGLGLQLVRFRVPGALDSYAALKKHLPVHLHEQLDRNHVYAPQATHLSSPAGNPATATIRVIADSGCKVQRIGMVDTAINTRHPAFAQSQIELKDFAGKEFPAPLAHGTAVAGVLVGSGAELAPLLPAAHLYAASVFYPRNEYTQGATMINLVRALDWLVEKKVAVINMSLAGPDNKILALAVGKVIQAGAVIVAAAGNEGPAAPPMYPAAYPDVIAVTAVDKDRRIYRWANRGDYIDFAALGVAVLTARGDGDFGRESGTSMAAPVVAAAAACAANETQQFPGANPVTHISERLINRTTDLGVPGRDPIFGYGLVR
jgi:hypothetical protein